MVPTLVAGQNLVVPTSKIYVAIRGEGGIFAAYALSLASSGVMRSADDCISLVHPSSADGSVQYRTGDAGVQAQFAVDLDKLPNDVHKVVFLLSTFGYKLSDFSSLSVAAETVEAVYGPHLFQARISVAQRSERALLLGELYRHKKQWKFRLVDQGSNEGLDSLLAQYDSQRSLHLDEDAVRRVQAAQREAAAQSASAPSATSSSVSTSASRVNLKKVSLTKSQPKVNLGKVQHLERGDGIYRVNLNWSRTAANTSASLWSRLFSVASGNEPVDLDLGAYVRFFNGAQTIVQALGKAFGHLHTPPFIELQGDDRTGDQADGEWLYINSQYIELFSEIVIFAFIYEGVAKWSDSDAVVTVDITGLPKVETRLYETYGVDNTKNMCAIARIRIEDNTISIERIEKYFRRHSEMDKYFGWGLNWTPGRK